MDKLKSFLGEIDVFINKLDSLYLTGWTPPTVRRYYIYIPKEPITVTLSTFNDRKAKIKDTLKSFKETIAKLSEVLEKNMKETEVAKPTPPAPPTPEPTAPTVPPVTTKPPKEKKFPWKWLGLGLGGILALGIPLFVLRKK